MFWKRQRAPESALISPKDARERQLDRSVDTMLGGMAIVAASWVASWTNGTEYSYAGILAGGVVSVGGVLSLGAVELSSKLESYRSVRGDSQSRQALDAARTIVDMAYANWREDRLAYVVIQPDQG